MLETDIRKLNQSIVTLTRVIAEANGIDLGADVAPLAKNKVEDDVPEEVKPETVTPVTEAVAPPVTAPPVAPVTPPVAVPPAAVAPSSPPPATLPPAAVAPVAPVVAPVAPAAAAAATVPAPVATEVPPRGTNTGDPVTSNTQESYVFTHNLISRTNAQTGSTQLVADVMATAGVPNFDTATDADRLRLNEAIGAAITTLGAQ